MLLSLLSMQAWGAGRVVASLATAEIAMQFPVWDQVDVLIADEQLGKGITGAELCAWVKGHHPHVKRILTSAAPAPPDVARVADRFIDKAHIADGLNTILAELRDGR